MEVEGCISQCVYNFLMLVQDNVSRSFTTCYIGGGLEIWDEISEEEVERGDSRERGKGEN